MEFLKNMCSFHHIVFETKYSRNRVKNEPIILDNQKRIIIAKAIKEVEQGYQFKIITGNILPDHIHLIILTWHLAISKIVNLIKGYSSYKSNQLLDYTVKGSGRQNNLWSRRYSNTLIKSKRQF